MTSTKGSFLREGSIEYRDYQHRLADAAKDGNTLIVLPTALGKTIVSALVADHVLCTQREARVLFMAPTRPLVSQHLDFFRKVFRLHPGFFCLLTGNVPPTQRELLWNGEARLFFSTPQVVKNDLETARLDLSAFPLLIFDECHRARQEYAYTHVAKAFMTQAGWPLLLGMTASPGANKEKISEICRSLFIEQILIRTELDEDVARYINPVKIETKPLALPETYVKAEQYIRRILEAQLSWLYDKHFIFRPPNRASRRDLLEAGERLRQRIRTATPAARGPLYSGIVAQSAALTVFHAIELLQTQGLPILWKFLHKISGEPTKRSYKNILNDPAWSLLHAHVAANSELDHPKLSLLISEVQAQLKKSEESKILVFTQYRETATRLVEKLASILNIPVARFVGQTAKLEDEGLSQKQQADVLDRFRSRDLRVLVATSIAEEGLDIPSVELVIFYEPVPSEIRYIQRKGRTGRTAIGRVVILVTSNSLDAANLNASLRRTERMRRLIASLNKELRPVLRRGPKPEPDWISREEISRLISAPSEPVTPLTAEYVGQARLEENQQFVRHTLEKAGSAGVEHQSLLETAQNHGFSSAETRTSLRRLIKERAVLQEGSTLRLNVSLDLSSLSDYPREAGAFDVQIEKIGSGEASVIVNRRWRAKLSPTDYEGDPRKLRKGSQFKAKGILFDYEGNLHLSILRLLETPDNQEPAHSSED